MLVESAFRSSSLGEAKLCRSDNFNEWICSGTQLRRVIRMLIVRPKDDATFQNLFETVGLGVVEQRGMSGGYRVFVDPRQSCFFGIHWRP